MVSTNGSSEAGEFGFGDFASGVISSSDSELDDEEEPDDVSSYSAKLFVAALAPGVVCLLWRTFFETTFGGLSFLISYHAVFYLKNRL